MDNNTYYLLTFELPTFSKTKRKERDLDSSMETLIHIHTYTPKIKAIAKDLLWYTIKSNKGCCSPDLREYWGIFFIIYRSIAKDLPVFQNYPKNYKIEQSSDPIYLIIHGQCYQIWSIQQSNSVSWGRSSLAPKRKITNECLASPEEENPH